jgi:hypothetical protein
VLTNGQVFVAGGEDPGLSTNGTVNVGTTNAELFNPQANGGKGSWTYIDPPENLFDPLMDEFADAPSVVLATGNVLIDNNLNNGYVQDYCLLYNPASSTWSATASSLSTQNEATWLKLPDDSILTIDIFGAGTTATAERYFPASGTWQPERNTPCATDGAGAETGGDLMLADGRAAFFLGSGHTLFYTPSGSTNVGTWQQGPDMPPLNTSQYPPYMTSTNSKGVITTYNYLQLSPEDAPVAMLPSGKVLCEFARDGNHMPVWFYEFDPVANQYVAAPSPSNSVPGSYYNVPGDNSDSTSMLELPDGTVLYNDSNKLFIYQPDATAPAAIGQPVVNSVIFNADGSLHLSGTVFNGFCQGVSYGDDCQMDSNYPLVRFTDGSGDVYYGRTYNWSSTSVRTGSRIVTTECAMPSYVYNTPGNWSLQVVANGIASSAVNFYSPIWVDFNYTSGQNFYFGTYNNPYNTLAKGISAVASGGTIAIRGDVQPSVSAETMTVSKAMNIIAVSGPSTVGQQP